MRVLCVQGGVAGGSITQGVLRVGQEIELRPGITSRTSSGAVKCTPIYSRILSLFAERNDLEIAVPGGLVGVGTHIDPTLTRADRLVGQVRRLPGCRAHATRSHLCACSCDWRACSCDCCGVVVVPSLVQVLGLRGHLPDVYIRVKVQYHLLRRLLGSKAHEGDKSAKVSRLKAGEMIMANIGSTSTSAKVRVGCVAVCVCDDLQAALTVYVCVCACAVVAQVASVVGQEATLELTQPVCTEVSGTDMAKIALSRRIDNHWRLIGWGTIVDGEKVAAKKERT